jgi:redox-sensitive bicupin YhaK (pirin superfamily)
VWHGGGAGESGLTRGFQLWVALPPQLELGPSVSIYQDAEDVRVAGPARVLLGAYEGASSAIRAPSEINYLALKILPDPVARKHFLSRQGDIDKASSHDLPA